MSKREKLLQSATSFCTSFATRSPPREIYSHFSSAPSVTALEHGLPHLAPFLGRAFTGPSGIREYFETISSVLTYEDMRFSNYVVDEEVGQVNVRGEARFTWISTEQSWDEVFTYVLEFDREYKVVRYEVWADSGAAYLASQGDLK